VSGGSCAEPAWSFVSASAVGSSHGRSGTPCQDASASELVARADGHHLVATVSDGAGSARLSHLGARLACAEVGAHARAFLARGLTLAQFERRHAEELLGRLAARLQRTARRADARPRDLACTLLFALLGPEGSVFAQLGDGAIVVAAADAPEHDYRCVFWPQRGEYANETRFVTEPDAAAAMEFEYRPGAVRELALLTDGLQNLVLDLQTRAAHARFFAPMFAALAPAEPGREAELSRALAQYLASPRVRTRTDDDTSLVLVRRVAREPAPALPQGPEQARSRAEARERA
jgi:serine/threonine protein phosphatase PrpC